MKNGATCFGVMPDSDLAYIILKRANKEGKYADRVIIELVQRGLECERTHIRKPDHVRVRK